jgi:hypothetical protein
VVEALVGAAALDLEYPALVGAPADVGALVGVAALVLEDPALAEAIADVEARAGVAALVLEDPALAEALADVEALVGVAPLVLEDPALEALAGAALRALTEARRRAVAAETSVPQVFADRAIFTKAAAFAELLREVLAALVFAVALVQSVAAVQSEAAVQSVTKEASEDDRPPPLKPWVVPDVHDAKMFWFKVPSSRS